MTNHAFVLSYVEVAMASVLILINAIISISLQLGLARSFVIAAIRMVLQLSLVGLVLKWVFATSYWPVVLGVVLLMTVIAAGAATNRVIYRYRGLWWDSFLSIAIASSLIAVFTFWVVLSIEPWYSPQYVIPIMGMVLGNTLTSIALCLKKVTSDLVAARPEIEYLQSLGATDWEAFRGVAKQALFVAMTPVINGMSVTGLVSLPGMMTGQILAGQDPSQAILYQIILMFCLSSSSAMACLLAIYFVYRRAFTAQHEFKADLVHKHV